jgi:hypothetical protein
MIQASLQMMMCGPGSKLRQVVTRGKAGKFLILLVDIPMRPNESVEISAVLHFAGKVPTSTDEVPSWSLVPSDRQAGSFKSNRRCFDSAALRST